MRVAPYDVRRAMVVKCQAHGTPCSGASVGGSGVINTSFRRPRAQLWPNQFPSRAPGVTPNAREFVSSSALQSGQLGVTTTALEGLILPSRVYACSHSHTKKAGALRPRLLPRYVLRDFLTLFIDPSVKKPGSPRGPLCRGQRPKAALKSERTSGSLRKQTKASVSPPAALETRRQSLQARTSLKLQTPLAASTTRVRCCDTSPFWRWPMPFTLQAGLLR